MNAYQKKTQILNNEVVQGLRKTKTNPKSVDR